MDKSQIVEKLQNNICRVTFIKADESERILIGTLKKDLIERQIEEQKKNQPEKRKPTTTKPPRTVPDTMVNVLELDPPQWRTFVIERLRKFEVQKPDGEYETIFEQGSETSTPASKDDANYLDQF